MRKTAATRFLPVLLALLIGTGCTGLPSSFTLQNDRPEPGALNLPGSQTSSTGSAGMVLGLDGHPAAGVTVTAHLISNNGSTLVSNNSQGYRVANRALETRTDESGRFKLLLPDDQAYNVEAVLSSEIKAMHLGISGSTAGLRMRLAYTGSITGRVTSDDPRVTNFEGTQVFIPGSSYVAMADAAGRFTLSNVAAGSFSLIAIKAGLGRGSLNGLTVTPRQATAAGDVLMHVTPPVLSSLTPLNGGPGTTMTITGEHFGATEGAPFQVFIGGAMAANPVRQNDTTLVVQVPGSATTGDTVVTVGGIPSNAGHFTVIKSLSFTQSGRNTTLLAGASRAFSVTALDTADEGVPNPNLTWSAEGPSVSVDSLGGVTALSPGYAKLAVSSGTVSETLELNVIQAYPESVMLVGKGNGYQDGSGDAVRFEGLGALEFAPNGDLYVADPGNHRIRLMTPEGEVTTFAGAGTPGYGGGGRADGSRLSALFKSPADLAVDAQGTVYLADSGNHDIRKISPSGEVTTLAGNGHAGFADGTGEAAQFSWPRGIVVTADGTLYVADSDNHRIRRITPNGQVSTFAGTGEEGDTDGPGAMAQFNSPQDLVLDKAGNLYVSDYDNQRIRKISPTGQVSTFAGTGEPGYADGPARKARFDNPGWMTLDRHGNLYVTDDFKNIRKISPGGTVYTLVGANGYARSGQSFVTGLGSPVGLAFGPDGSLFVAEYLADWIRKFSPER